MEVLIKAGGGREELEECSIHFSAAFATKFGRFFIMFATPSPLFFSASPSALAKLAKIIYALPKNIRQHSWHVCGCMCVCLSGCLVCVWVSAWGIIMITHTQRLQQSCAALLAVSAPQK